MRTDDPHIWAIGDAVEVTDHVRRAPTAVPLAGPANKQARVVAASIMADLGVGSVGTERPWRGASGWRCCGAAPWPWMARPWRRSLASRTARAASV